MAPDINIVVEVWDSPNEEYNYDELYRWLPWLHLPTHHRQDIRMAWYAIGEIAMTLEYQPRAQPVDGASPETLNLAGDNDPYPRCLDINILKRAFELYQEQYTASDDGYVERVFGTVLFVADHAADKVRVWVFVE